MRWARVSLQSQTELGSRLHNVEFVVLISGCRGEGECLADVPVKWLPAVACSGSG